MAVGFFGNGPESPEAGFTERKGTGLELSDRFLSGVGARHEVTQICVARCFDRERDHGACCVR
jgi:hypothetical protein